MQWGVPLFPYSQSIFADRTWQPEKGKGWKENERDGKRWKAMKERGNKHRTQTLQTQVFQKI